MNLARKISRALVVFAVTTGVFRPGLADWPQWRGPDGQGHAGDATLPVEWSETKNVRWKTPIPGRAWSSPVILANEVWLTTAMEIEASPEEADRRLKANTGDQPLNVAARADYRVIGVAADTGRIIRDVEVLSTKDPQWVHKLNSYASPTPVIEPGRLYANFGSSGTVCVDTTTGKRLWANTELQVRHENGPGSSPVLWKDRLILHMDGSDQQYVVAYEKGSGRIAWKTARTGSMHSNPQLTKSCATPLILRIDGKDQLISPGPNWLYGYDPDTGRELWKISYETLGFSLAARPVAGHGHVYLSTGYLRPELLAVRVGGGRPPSISWRYARGVPTMSSPVLVGNELYFVADSGGFLTCLDALTGKEHYRERLGGDHSASLLHNAGRIHVPARNGVTHVVEAGKTFRVVSKNEISGQLQASAAVLGNALFLRTDSALYRIENGGR